VFLPHLIGLLQGSGSDGADAVASFAASIKVAKTTTDCSFVLAEPSRHLRWPPAPSRDFAVGANIEQKLDFFCKIAD
jgi:hypothetical protein